MLKKNLLKNRTSICTRKVNKKFTFSSHKTWTFSHLKSTTNLHGVIDYTLLRLSFDWTEPSLTINLKQLSFYPPFMHKKAFFFFLIIYISKFYRNFQGQTHRLRKFQLQNMQNSQNIHPVGKITAKSRNQTQISAKAILLTKNVIKSMGSPTRELQ